MMSSYVVSVTAIVSSINVPAVQFAGASLPRLLLSSIFSPESSVPEMEKLTVIPPSVDAWEVAVKLANEMDGGDVLKFQNSFITMANFFIESHRKIKLFKLSNSK